jgi:hypothetical protein
MKKILTTLMISLFLASVGWTDCTITVNISVSDESTHVDVE